MGLPSFSQRLLSASGGDPPLADNLLTQLTQLTYLFYQKFQFKQGSF
jgi:hypothetical protein